MSFTSRQVGMAPTGEKIVEYTYTNGKGASYSVLNFGGTLNRLKVPDREGKLRDVVLGFDDLNRYLEGKAGCAGSLIGRVGNRIEGAAFTLEGVEYHLGKNDGNHNIHGGPVGFGLRFWDVETAEPDALICRLISEDGDQNFPGRLEVTVTYTLSEENCLNIHYRAFTDKTTLCNLTNHAYFNLNGSGTIHDHLLQINASHVAEADEELILSGRLIPVQDVVYDFSSPTRIGDVLSRMDEDPVMAHAGGVDFNYCAGRDRETKLIATLYSPESGIELKVITDQPGVQCYTGQCFSGMGKDGIPYQPYCGVALETQHYPDSIHHPDFPSTVLRPQDVYDTFTAFCFDVRS